MARNFRSQCILFSDRTVLVVYSLQLGITGMVSFVLRSQKLMSWWVGLLNQLLVVGLADDTSQHTFRHSRLIPCLKALHLSHWCRRIPLLATHYPSLPASL